MKKNLTTLFIAASVIALAVGCKGKDKVVNDPKAVVIAFFEKMAKKDMDGAAKYATKDSKGTIDMMKKAMSAAEGMKDMKTDKSDPTDDFKNVEFGEAKIDGDNATVSIKNTKKGESFDFPLKKEDGDWKVDFSMGTLMKMGMKEAGENNGLMNDENNGIDSAGINDKMNEIMDSDSLQKSLEQLNNELKNIDPEKMKEALKSLEKMKEQ